MIKSVFKTSKNTGRKKVFLKKTKKAGQTLTRHTHSK